MNDVLYDPKRVAAAMDEAGLDALIATTPPNVQYITRFRRAGGSLAVVGRADIAHPCLIVDASGVDYCLEDPCEPVQIRVFGTFYRSFAEGVSLDERETFVQRLHHETRHDAVGWDLLAEQLNSMGLKAGAIGTDGTADSLTRVLDALPELHVKSTPHIFGYLRMVKSQEETCRLAEAARITEHAILTSAHSAFRGATQQHLARVFSLTAIAANSFVRQDNASVGRGSALGNLNSPADVVEDGSIIRYDVGVHYQGYASDMARSFAFRTASAKVRSYHAALVAGQDRALELIRPGVAAHEIFEAAVAGVRRAGIPHYERTHVGHGIGIAGSPSYDPPRLAPSDDTILEPGMVLCVETPYVELGFGSLHVEDMVVVTPEGYLPLTHTPRGLKVIP